MDVNITQDAIDKLTHDCEEIRCRMLEQIESKVLRALSHQLTIDFEPLQLFKQLIQWLSYETTPETYIKVLNLMFHILKSNYRGEVLEYLRVTSLRVELFKIRLLLHENSEVVDRVRKICDILFEYENIAKVNQVSNHLHEIQSSVNQNVSSYRFSNLSTQDYEIRWSKPNEAEYKTLRELAEMLTSSAEEKTTVLQYLPFIMSDYPAEYMLQPPHIFSILVVLCADEDEMIQTNVIASLKSFMKVLKQDLKKRLKINSHSVKREITYSSEQNNIDDGAKSQIKIGKAMELLLEICFEILNTQKICVSKITLFAMDTIIKVLEIMKLQQICIQWDIFRKCDQLKVKFNKIYKENAIITRSMHIWVTFILIEMNEINAKRSQDADKRQRFIPMLLDYSLFIHYSNLFERIKKVSFFCDVAVEKSYKELQVVQSLIDKAISLQTKTPTKLSHLIEEGYSIIPIFDVLKSLKLTNIVIHAILKATPLYLTDHELREKATALLQHFVHLETSNIRLYAYQSISKAIKKHFAALMNHETIFEGIQNKQLISALIIGIPLDKNVLLQVAYDSYDSKYKEVQKYAENIISLVLRSYHFYETDFKAFEQVISPILPVLQCCVHFETINDILLKLLNPDLKLFSFFDSLRGNIVFMFSHDGVVRREALVRLGYILSSMPQSAAYVPDVISIASELPNDLFILQTPIDFQQIFGLYGSPLTDLRALLALLDTKDIDPTIRKSALVQLNIICKNINVIKDFCEEQAHCLLLLTLESALTKGNFNDDPENVIPTISMLVKLLIVDCTFRHELARIPNIYVLLLRAVFYFPHEVQLRQDASVCMFLLVFDSMIAVLPNMRYIEAPTILNNLKVPLICKFSLISKKDAIANTIPDIKVFKSSNIEWKSYVRQVVAHSCLKVENFARSDEQPNRVKLDICDSLIADQDDTLFTSATNFYQNVHSILRSISSATDHNAFIKYANSLRLQLILFSLENANLAKIPEALCNAICTLLNIHLQRIPKSEVEYQAYSCVLTILHMCVSNEALPIIQNLKGILFTDLNHCVIMMLKNRDSPLDIYLQLTELLLALLNSTSNEIKNTDFGFRKNFFQYVHAIAMQFFGSRHLHKMRCLLKLMRSLTCIKIGLSEQTLYKYSNSLIKLSIRLRSFTQTGAQLHRDCLLIFIQLLNQTSEELKLNITEIFLKHIAGFCAHKDEEVRALAWICLSVIAFKKTKSIVKFEGIYENGSRLIQNQIDYIPGGFNSCLNTFLDKHEVILVRNCAGNLFVQILNEFNNFETLQQLLEFQTFFSSANDSLDSYMLESAFSKSSSSLKQLQDVEEHNSLEIITFETVIYYCRICLSLIKLQSAFVKELYEKPLLCKFHDLLKIPFKPTDVGHYEMCAQICHLLARCSKDSFIFFQRIKCCDEFWLACVFDLLNPPAEVSNEAISCVLQLIIVLSRETHVFRRLCEWLSGNRDGFRNLISRVLIVTHMDSALQRYLIKLLIILVIKAQSGKTDELEKTKLMVFFEKQYNVSEDATNICQGINSSNVFESVEENKYSDTNLNMFDLRLKTAEKPKEKILDADKKSSLSELTFLSLYKIFLNLHPFHSHNFCAAPSELKLQICEALSLLLKVSPSARLTADNLKVLNTILLICENFFGEFGNVGTNFIKRHGERKKIIIIKNLQIMFQILLRWFSSSYGILVDDFQTIALSKVILKSWDWIQNSYELKLLHLKVCAFLSERSLQACVKFSGLISGYSASVLQFVTKFTIAESYKIKQKISSNMQGVATGLRVMMNCSACPEGRFILLKQNAFEIFETFYPFSLKTLLINEELLNHWLELWELFSRYNEGENARNLNALCTLINQSIQYSKTRLLCLKILRNLCFFKQNRSMAILSSNFRYTLDEVINQRVKVKKDYPVSFEEHFIICVAVWKLISGGIKFITMFHGTKLAHNLHTLRQILNVLSHDERYLFEKIPFAVDLSNVLEIITNIFSLN